MSWRSNPSESTYERSHPSDENSKTQYSLHQHYDDYEREILPLVKKIGNRDVVVDACLPPQLANDLRRIHVNAIWVPAILGDGATDGEIERQLLLSGRWNKLWGGENRDKVLLTRDVEFYKRVRSKAILISYRATNSSARKLQSNIAIKKELKRMMREDTKA